MPDLPKLALSVRQPWAWAIIYQGKGVENRDRGAMNFLRHRGPCCIHASKGMTRGEYEDAKAFMARFGVEVPPASELERGGIIGTVDVIGSITGQSAVGNRWYMGGCGLFMKNAQRCAFIPATGALGFFDWRRESERQPPTPVEYPGWMRMAATVAKPGGLFET